MSDFSKFQEQLEALSRRVKELSKDQNKPASSEADIIKDVLDEADTLGWHPLRLSDDSYVLIKNLKRNFIQKPLRSSFDQYQYVLAFLVDLHRDKDHDAFINSVMSWTGAQIITDNSRTMIEKLRDLNQEL